MVRKPSTTNDEACDNCHRRKRRAVVTVDGKQRFMCKQCTLEVVERGADSKVVQMPSEGDGSQTLRAPRSANMAADAPPPQQPQPPDLNQVLLASKRSVREALAPALDKPEGSESPTITEV
jgi:hypothetical protein